MRATDDERANEPAIEPTNGIADDIVSDCESDDAEPNACSDQDSDDCNAER